MPKPRRSACTVSSRVSSDQMLPRVSGSRPARQFSAVDLPQPDGPSRAMNSPRRTVRSRSVNASWPAKLLVTPSNRNSAKLTRSRLLLVTAGLANPAHSSHSLAHLCAADLAVPPTERLDQRLGVQRYLQRVRSDQLLVLRAAVLLDRLAAGLRRHRQRHVLDRRTGIEV